MLPSHSDIALGQPGLQGGLQINSDKPLNSQASSPLLQDRVENTERLVTERVLDWDVQMKGGGVWSWRIR